MPHEYGTATANTISLNDVERDLVLSALATAQVECHRRADENEPGSHRRGVNEGMANEFARLARRINFPNQPEQW